MENLLFCPNCGEYCSYTIHIEEETYPVKGENTSIEAEVSYCDCCGKQLWNEKLDEQNLQKAYTIYRNNHGLLSPIEIKNIREKYGVSQATFSKIMGMGEKTITRYENGSIPDKAYSNLILLLRDPANFKELVDQNKDELTDVEYKHIQDALNSLTMKIEIPASTYKYGENTIIVTNSYWGGKRRNA